MRAGATAAGCGAIALWAFLALLTKAADGVPPLQLTAMAFCVSGGCGLAWLAARRRLGVLRQPAAAWAHGAGGLFLYHALYFAALGLAPVVEVNIVNYLWPLLIVTLSAALLGLRLRALHWVGAALCVAGCGLVVWRGAGFAASGAVGYGLAAASALTWALYSVLSRRFASVPGEAVAGFCAASALLACVTHAVTEPTVVPDRAGWLAALALGLGPVGAAFLLWDHGMKRGDPRLLGTLAYAIPVGSTLLLCAAGYAALSAATVVGACLVGAGGFAAARA